MKNNLIKILSIIVHDRNKYNHPKLYNICSTINTDINNVTCTKLKLSCSNCLLSLRAPKAKSLKYLKVADYEK